MRQGSGSILRAKDEILRLIDRIQSPPKGAAFRAARRSAARVTGPPTSTDSAALPAEARDGLERELLEAKLLGLYAHLDQRIARLETSEAPSGRRQLSNGQPSAQEQRFAASTLAGQIREGVIADVLQLIASNMFNGIFTVESEGVAVNVVFVEGEIRHAECDGMTGESAFFAAMRMEQGRFYFVETTDLPSETTIESKAQFLILEALRQIDEQRAES